MRYEIDWHEESDGNNEQRLFGVFGHHVGIKVWKEHATRTSFVTVISIMVTGTVTVKVTVIA
jgi:hypothetical protein